VPLRGSLRLSLVVRPTLAHSPLLQSRLFIAGGTLMLVSLVSILLPAEKTPAFDDLQMLAGTLEKPAQALRCNTKGPTTAAIELSHLGTHVDGEVRGSGLLCVSGIGQRLMQLTPGESIQVWVLRTDSPGSASLRIWQLSSNGKPLLPFDASRLENDARNVRRANSLWFVLCGLAGGCCLMPVAWRRNRSRQLSAGHS